MRSRPLIYVLNIFGLATGIAACLFIFSYAGHHLSYDRHHENYEHLYRVNHIIKQENQDNYIGAATFPRVGPALREEFDQVMNSARVSKVWGTAVTFVENDPIQREGLLFADPALLQMFDIPLLHGDPNTALNHPYTAIISSDVAMQHFGTQECVGKSFKLKTNNGDQSYEVTGVFETSAPSHLNASIYFSFNSLWADLGYEHDRNWLWFDYVTYLQLRPDTDLKALDEAFVAFIDKHGGERLGSNRIDFDLIPVTDIHLKSNINQEISTNGDFTTIRFLLLLGTFIMIIAWINYLNLYTAKAIERGKEVAIRKTLGSSKKSLIFQYLIESGFVNLLGIVIGLIFLWLIGQSVPLFIDIDLPHQMVSPKLLLILPVFWLFSSLISGTYPSVFIANFKILKALKGSSGVTSGGKLRKGLVVFQFMVAGFMIAGTILVYRQLQFINNLETGINTEQTLIIESPQMQDNEQQFINDLNFLKQSFLNINGVKEVAFSSDIPGKQVGWRGSSATLNSKPFDRKIVYKMTVGHDYLDFLDAPFLAGRNFIGPSDSLSVVINKAAMSLYGFSDPESILNERIRFAGLDTLRVIGVVDNYYQESIRENVKPTVYLLISQELKYLSVRINPTQTSDFIAKAEQLFQQTFENVPFNWYPLDAMLQKRHQQEAQFNTLFNAFACLTIAISFLGLLGLAYFTAEKRKKEMGIRKVLGSSVSGIIRLVYSDFARLVLLGNLLAIPLFIYLGQQWLNQFIRQVDLSWIVPLVTMVITLGMAFIFTLFHLIRLGKTNPVEVLKDE